MTTEQSELQANKRPSKAITYEEKLAILKELDAGASRREIELVFKCSQSTISRVLLGRETIMQLADSAVLENGMKDALILNKEIDEPLTMWAHEIKRSGESITANMVKEKAEELAKEIGVIFRYSSHWLFQWKARENIRFTRPKEPECQEEILKNLLYKKVENVQKGIHAYEENAKRIKLEDESLKDISLQEDKSQEAEGFRSESFNSSMETPEKPPRIKREYIRRMPAFMKVEGGPEYPGTIYRSRKEKTFLTLLQKLEILQRLKNGERRPDLIIEYKLSQSAMSQIVSDEDKILKLAAGGQNLQMKRVRGGIFKDGEAELNAWVHEKMKIGESLTRTQIKNKAKEIADRLNIDFKASTGWLEKWKARMNLDFNENQILHRKVPKYLSNEEDSVNETDETQRKERKNKKENSVIIPETIIKLENVDSDTENYDNDYCYDAEEADIKPELLTPQQFYMQTIQEDRQLAQQHQQQEQQLEEIEEPEDIKPFIGTPPHIASISEYPETTLHEQVLSWLNKYKVSPMAATDLLNILQPHLDSKVIPTKTSTPLNKTHRYI